jgi:hypothetical protein
LKDAFVIRDAAGSDVAFVYFDREPTPALRANHDQARRIAEDIATLPELIAMAYREEEAKAETATDATKETTDPSSLPPTDERASSPPRRIVEHADSVEIQDAAGRTIFHLYFENHDEARRLASNVAKMPEFVGK